MRSQRSKKRALQSFVAMLAIGIVVSACASTSADESSAAADAVLGTWGDTAATKPHLVFSSDGEVKGSDGCNGISTTFAVDGSTAVLEQFVSTLKGCFGVDPWLSKVHSVEVDGDQLLVSNSQGERIGTLERAE